MVNLMVLLNFTSPMDKKFRSYVWTQVSDMEACSSSSQSTSLNPAQVNIDFFLCENGVLGSFSLLVGRGSQHVPWGHDSQK